MKPIVYVLDGDPAVIRAVTKLVAGIGLEAQGYQSAEKFLEAYRPAGPACLVLEVRIPGMSGLELQERLKSAGSSLPIIFVTSYADVRMAVEVMEKGAFGLLEKPFRPQELCDKIQKAIRLDQENWQRRQQQEAVNRRLEPLTPAERKVFDRVVAGQTNKMIAEGLGLSVRTVEVHRSRMLKKLGVKSRADLLSLMAAPPPQTKPTPPAE
jgi:two-component system response regulator TtrR